MAFPLEKYFDAAAATPLDPKVKEAMLSVMDVYGNNNSKHTAGFEAQKLIDRALGQIAEVLKCPRDNLAIAYAGTDANRRIIWECRKRFGEKNLWASKVEHSSVLEEIPEQNRFDPYTLEGLPKEAAFAALMGANAETGAIYEATELRKSFPNTLILRDYSQSFAKGLFPDLANADFGVFTPQKFYGPKHIAIIYLKYPQLFPAISKDTHTKNPMLVVGAAQAFIQWEKEREASTQKLQSFEALIRSYIQAHIPHYKFHDADKARVPGIISVAFKGVRGSELMTVLSSEESICVSTGSACTTDILSPTTVMRYIEKDPTWQYPIRISLHKFLTKEAVEDFCEILAYYVSELRKWQH